MSKNRVLSFVLVLIFSFPFFTQDAEPTNLVISENGVELTFESLENGIALFRNSDKVQVPIELSKMSSDNLKKVMKFTGWGRVWEDATGKHRTIADLVSVVSETVVLENLAGKEIVVPLDRLSKEDREYAEARRKLSSDALPDHFVAKVVSIHDGDTITVLLNRRQYKVRISGIDAPENGQDFSSKAKQHLGDLIHGKMVVGTRESTDKYGRNIATITFGDVRVDMDMLKNGLAWHYTEYSKDSERTEIESTARKNKTNLWSEANPIPPWDWRKWGSAKRKEWSESKLQKSKVIQSESQNSTKKDKSDPAQDKSYWLNTKSQVRHNSSCRWFENTKGGRHCTKNEGRACDKCGG